MSEQSVVRIERRDEGVAWLWLDRPKKHNALNEQMIAELREATAALAGDTAVRVVVLAADGNSFCAGGDLAWMKVQAAADNATKRAQANELAMLLGELDGLPKPLIGRVQGNAYGGGVGMIAVCDIVVANEAASFALTETKLGLVPATIGPYVVRRLGEANVRRVFFNSRPFSADEAERMGLVSRLAPVEGLDDAVAREVAWFLDCAPGAVADAKALALGLARGTYADPVAHSIDSLVERWGTSEARQGIAAFLERRPMPWARQRA